MLTLQKNTNRQRRKKLISEINVTPLVDVMLVLLIIFMITAPMLVTGVDVNLPTGISAPINTKDKPLIITIDQNQHIYLAKTKINLEEIEHKLKHITKNQQDKKIFIKGDQEAKHGIIIQLVSKIKNAGFNQVAFLLTESDD